MRCRWILIESLKRTRCHNINFSKLTPLMSYFTNPNKFIYKNDMFSAHTALFGLARSTVSVILTKENKLYIETSND